ncbi:glutaminase [Streptomyces sp. NBC_01217]|nr:glutaminase [Streptomyces sp. NBC_01217]
MSAAAEAVTDALRELHTRFAGLRDGQLADYIPQLALADPDAFGLALISMDGHRYSTGDADATFTCSPCRSRSSTPWPCPSSGSTRSAAG